MVGRFIDHDGGNINMPAARFGNISVMPSPISVEGYAAVDAYCIDLHSRSGYSGSPVFVYRTPGYDLEERQSEPTTVLRAGTIYFNLRGIHFAQFPEHWEIALGVSYMDKESHGVPLTADGGYVKGLSGMTCVLPSWAILEVLNLPSVRYKRDKEDIDLYRTLLKHAAPTLEA